MDVFTAGLAKNIMPNAPHTIMNRHFAPNTKILLLAALLLPVLLYLGNWQLGRANEKRQILAQLETRSALPPVPLEQLLGEPETRYRQAQTSGSFDNRHSFLLDNRVRDSRPGYEVITPFYTNSGHWILVNRGWISAPRMRSELPDIPRTEGEVSIRGTIYSPLEKTPDHYSLRTEWPKVIQNIHFANMSDNLNHPLPEITLRLDNVQPGALRTGWSAINVQPEKHTAYAVQWFAMALALLILTTLFCFPKKRSTDD
ncbi:SURF1 family protein [Porticoccus sp. GXU_MW_L64]